jgi:hypothetical protein
MTTTAPVFLASLALLGGLAPLPAAARGSAAVAAACTMEAMICPDGSAVSRTGPECSFPACPSARAVGLPAGDDGPTDSSVSPGSPGAGANDLSLCSPVATMRRASQTRPPQALLSPTVALTRPSALPAQAGSCTGAKLNELRSEALLESRRFRRLLKLFSAKACFLRGRRKVCYFLYANLDRS